MPDPIDLSIVVPLYNEVENITVLFDKLDTVLKSLDKIYEVIFVDDGSRDSSFDVVKTISSTYPSVKGISLSRNFGHQIALLAGMQHAQGNLVITMDADLQHPPEVIPLLIKEYEKGFDIVNTCRIDSREIGYFKKSSSKLFYRMINRISEVPINESSSDFRLMSRKALDSFLQFGERGRFTRGLVSWMGTGKAWWTMRAPPGLQASRSIPSER